jgi:protein tyrosine phosphatase
MAARWPTSLSNFLLCDDATSSMFATLMMFANDTTTTATTSAAIAAGARRSPHMEDPAGIFFYEGSDGCITNDGGPGLVGNATMSTTPKQEEKKMKKKNKERDHDSEYEAEYKQLARDELEDMLLTGELPDFASGQASCNERKNRYSNNLPLERTRVKLAPRPHAPGSDYINASHIHAPVHACRAKAEDDDDDDDEVEAEYIAAQAPLAGTCGDFWRMVAEREAGLVVMLTRLREGERTKATRYWPRRVGRTTRFGEVRVRLVSVHSHYGPARDDLIVRRFLIRRVRVRQPPQLNQQQQHDDDGMHDDDDEGHDNYDAMAASEESEVEGEESGEGEWREVVHLHYQAWPDFGRPATDSFRELLRMVDDFHVGAHAGPIVTHCSAGLGRTGVLIAAHIALAQLRRTAAAAGVVRPDVYATVRHIRKQRPGMVQTLEQYTFIHEVVNDLLAEREAAASLMTTTTTTTSTITADTTTATTTSRARASAHTATKRCSSSPPRISSGRSSARGGGAFSPSLGWSATSAPSASSGCCSLVDDLMDYDITSSCAAELGLASAHHHHQAAVRREQQRGRQGLCSSTPAICMRV